MKEEKEIFRWEMFKGQLKKVVFFIGYFSGILHLMILFLKTIMKRHVAIILFYHRFCDGSNNNYLLPHLNIKDFKKQICHIKRWYKVITMDELAEKVAGKKEFDEPSIIITIDDGYLNNYTLAYPILKRLNLPATIYLTSGFIGSNKAPWVDDLMEILSLTKKKELHFPGLYVKEVIDISNQSGKMDVIKRLFNMMVRMEPKQRKAMVETLSNILNVNDWSIGDTKRKMLNWSEVAEMSQNNILFGAHTITHPNLNKMEISEAKKEIYESKLEIENRIGREVRHFAIPNGKKEDFSEELKVYCKEIGFKTVASTEPGIISSKTDPYFIKRVNLPAPIYMFACELARYIFLNRKS